jgi:hypothetical protein
VAISTGCCETSKAPIFLFPPARSLTHYGGKPGRQQPSQLQKDWRHLADAAYAGVEFIAAAGNPAPLYESRRCGYQVIGKYLGER